MSKLRVVHYLNQFFAGVGGEEKAGEGPRVQEGALGPGLALQRALGDQGEVVATVSCGDNYISEQPEQALEQVLEYVSKYQPDLVVAGPAFNAGRYGLACGQVCAAVQERLQVPAVTGMYPDNPGVELYRARVYIVPTGVSAATMAAALERIAPLGLKLARKERLGRPAEEGYLPRGLRFNERADRPAAVRAVEMLVKRLRGEAVETERPLPQYDRVAAPPPLKDLSKATIALVSSGGVVPRGNPDRMESTFATKWLKYNLAGVTDLTAEAWQSVHGGYDTTVANEDPNRVLPVDVLREFEAQGAVGRIHDHYYVTVGSGASTTTAKRFGQEIARELVAAGVDAVIFTAT